MPQGNGGEIGRDPAGARWAYVAAATGTAANALLVSFFAAIPVAGRGNPFGPANDIVGSVATACMIPAAVAIGRRLPPRGRLRALHAATLGSLAVATAAGPLLVAGVLSFPVSAAASTSAFGVQAAWIGLGSRWLGRNSGLPRRTTRLGQAIAVGALVGAGAAAGSLVAPGALRTRDARRRRCCRRDRLPGRSRVVGAHGPLAGQRCKCCSR